MIITAQEAAKLTPSIVEQICEKIKKTATGGKSKLELYKIEDYHDDCGYSYEYNRIFEYADKDIIELRNLGYTLTVDHSESINKKYTGIWPFRKLISFDIVNYYSVSWPQK